ncbi:hypothetical protein AB1Y20_006750 [Prymnesium parvum]|uniref:Uncharacterized protein n=1 Tax=Prymnesium parvum TaxID=97485 RepID=A0AB34J170_PRYPA|mmetsp:Transcript_17951/g.45032  ORF Transcript_17951/g.45032 Transcript_17951/m.45032 type:complete len:152 (+) Transcript_17951:65-520(+)
MPSHRRTLSDGYTFNPVEALVEDAVGDTSELFTDFLDKLLVHVPLEAELVSSLPIELPNKRPKADEMTIGSPISTIDLIPSMDIDVGAPDSPSSRNSGGLSRKNKPQRCSICKECGHKSRTCKFTLNQKDGTMLQDSEPSSLLPAQSNLSL